MTRHFEMEIHPVKWLYYHLPEQTENIAVLIASSYDVRHDKLDSVKILLVLSFADITDSKNPQALRPEQAVEIHSYIDNLPTNITRLFICCESGESRSAAIAAAVLRYFGDDDMHIWQNPHLHPNSLVYSMLCEEFGCTVMSAELEQKLSISNNAFNEAVEVHRKNTGTPEIIDIHSKGEYPSCALSNFFAHSFVIDSVRCASMEGFLQALKFRSTARQIKVCSLSGKEAKNSTKYTFAQFRWKLTQTLYWQGKKYKRDSDDYQLLLDRAYENLSENTDFTTALKLTADADLCHTIGEKNSRKTVLTEEEFVSRLLNIRRKL